MNDRAIRWMFGVFQFRNTLGQIRSYSDRDVADMPMSDDSRKMMERLQMLAVDREGEWIEYSSVVKP